MLDLRRLVIVATGSLGACLLGACVTVPAGPSVMVLPGSRTSFDQFQGDDWTCRSWAARQTGTTVNQASTQSAVTGAAVGTAVGAAAGAAIGAAHGSPGAGAAVGAGSGLLLGSAAGASQGAWSGAAVQERYDNAYLQCMYAKGNQIPMAGASPRASSAAPLPHRRPTRPLRVPPPPRGPPPPPPPGFQ